MNFLQKKQLQQRLRQDPYYRLQSLEEVQIAAQTGVKIDVNRATVDDWLRLPGISIHQGRSLVSLTEKGVQFYALEDVAAALGMRVERLKPLEPILSFAYYTPELAPVQINVNSAPLADFVKLGIGTDLAQRIIAGRTGGNYRDFADLQTRLHLAAEEVMLLLHRLRFR